MRVSEICVQPCFIVCSCRSFFLAIVVVRAELVLAELVAVGEVVVAVGEEDVVVGDSSVITSISDEEEIRKNESTYYCSTYRQCQLFSRPYSAHERSGTGSHVQLFIAWPSATPTS